MKVDRIYTRNIASLPITANVEQAAALMYSAHVGALVVTDGSPEGSRAVGALTDRDIVIQTIARGYDPREFTVGEGIDGLAADLARLAAGLKTGIARESRLRDRVLA